MNCSNNLDSTTSIDIINDKYENTYKVQKELLMSKFVSTYESNEESLINNLENNIDCLNNNLFLVENIVANKNIELSNKLNKKNIDERKTYNNLVKSKDEYKSELGDKQASIPRYYDTELKKLINKVEIFSKLGISCYMIYKIYMATRD